MDLGFNLGIAGINKPAVTGVDKTQIKKAPTEVKKTIAQQISKPVQASSTPTTIGRITQKSSMDGELRGAVYDISNGQPTDKVASAYPVIGGKINDVLDLMTDVKGGSGLNDVIKSYPEFSPEAISDIFQGLGVQVKEPVKQKDINNGIEITQSQYDRYKEEFTKLKDSGSKAYNLYRVPEGDNVVSKLINGVKGKYKDVGFDNELQLYILEKEKSLGDVATKDLGAFPSEVAGVVSAPIKAVGNLRALAKGESSPNEKIDTFFNKLGVKTDGRYDAGAIAGELGMSAIAIEGILGNISKVGQISKLVSKFPKIAKYITKPVIQGIGYQGASDVVKGELSSAKQYTKSALLSLGANAVAGIASGIGDFVKSPKKYRQNTVKNVDAKTLEDVANKTDEFKINKDAQNPLEGIIKKIDGIKTKILSNKGEVGGELGKMRKQLKTINYSTEDAINQLNTALKGNEIAATIKKVKGVYKVIGGATKSEGKGTILKEIVSEINSLKELGTNNKLAGLDKINQNIKYLIKSSKMEGSLNNALGKISSEFTKTIDGALEQYGTKRGQYGKLAELESSLKNLGSDAGAKAIATLSKVTPYGNKAEVESLLRQLKELGYTKDDLLGEVLATNYIMQSKLGLSEFQKAIDNIYPSVPGAAEALIKTTKGAAVNKTRQLIKKSKNFKDIEYFKNKNIQKYIGGTEGQVNKLERTLISAEASKLSNKNKDK